MLVIGGVLLPFALGVFQFLFGDKRAAWSLIFAGVSSGAIVVLLTYPLYYEIGDALLIIRCGILIRLKIPLDSIEGARPTRNPLSAPAWSLDRLQIDYRKNDGVQYALISPEDKTGFMREIASKGTRLKFDGERVVGEF